MMASLFLSRVLGLVRNAVIAALFGQSVLTDAYIQSFKIPDLIFFLVAGGALSSAFIPVFSEYLHTNREDEAWHVFSSVVSLMTVIVLGFIALAWIFAPQIVRLMFDSPGTWDTAAYLSRIVLPAQLAFFVGGLMFGTLYARQKFTVPGLGPNLYNLGITFGGVVLSHFVNPSIAGLSWGALVGAFLGNIVVPFFAMRQSGARFKIVFDTAHAGVRKVFRLMLPVVLGLSLPAIYGIVMSSFGSRYEAGMVTALDNGDRIMQAPLAVFGQSLAIAAFPALSQFFAQNRMDAFKDQLSKTLRTVLYLSIPMSALMVAMPEGIIKILLEHGKFGALETARTAPVLQVFALGVAAWCMQPVLMRAYFSIQQTLRPIVISTVCTGLFVLLCLTLPNLGLKHLGLPLAGSIAASVLVIVLLLGLRPFVGGFDARGILSTLVKCLGASLVMALPAWYATHLLLGIHPSKGVLLFGVVMIGLCSVWIYIGLTRLLKMPEAAYVDRAMKRLDRQKKQAPGDERISEIVEESDLIDPEA